MDLLPFEIWEEVASNLKAHDLINFCKACDELSYLLRDKSIVINFDLGGCFDYCFEQVYQTLSQDIGFEYIKYLNLNKLYWIRLEEFREIVKLLPNLVELRALDTVLGMREDDVVLYKKLKILSISVEADQFTSSRETYREYLGNLQSMCIKFVSKYRADFRRIYYMFFNELRKLNELWIYDADDMEVQALRYDYIVCNLRNLTKLVIKSKLNLTLLDYKPFGLIKVFERRRCDHTSTTICYGVKSDSVRLRSLSEEFECKTEKSWNVVNSFLGEIPCSFRTALNIRNSNTIMNLEFQELGFYHSRLCNATFINSVIDLLLSKRCRGLKRLGLTFCILQEAIGKKGEKQNVFMHIVNNCRQLTELEIVSCSNIEPIEIDTVPVKVPCYSSAVLSAYDLISTLKQLKKLRLEIPQYVNGSFLQDVLLKCPDLQYLNIFSDGNNEDLNSVLYSHLNYAQNLREFRYENVHIDLDRLFSAFNKVFNSKLQRVVVKCDYEHSTKLWPLEKLLRRNNNILFLVILVSKYNRHQINRLQDMINQFLDQPAKVYVAKTYMSPDDDIGIPEAHKDILYFSSDVANLHFSDF